MKRTIIKMIFGIAIISLSINKALTFPQFVLDVQKYNILPVVLILPFSLFVVSIELVSGIGIIFNIYSKHLIGTIILLFTVFTLGIVINLFQGNIIECGCYGSIYKENIGWWSVLRNSLLIIILVWLFQSEKYNEK